MFPTPFPSSQSQQIQQPRNPSHSHNPRIQTQGQVENQPIVYQPSAALKRLKNVNKLYFLLMNFSIGVGIINFFRLSRPHIFLGVIGIVIGSIALFVISPTDRSYVGLWRTGGVSLLFGGILCFWDLYHLLTWQHYVAIGIVLFLIFILAVFALWIIGADS